MARINLSEISSYAVAAFASLYCSAMFLAAASANSAALGRLIV